MKRIFSIALVAMLSLFTACGEVEDNGANFKLTSGNQWEVAAEGGTVAITYSIQNHISGAAVETTVTAGSEAVKSLTKPTEGVILVEIKANTTSESRIIIVHAAYGAEAFDVVISQKSGNGGSDSSDDEFDVVFEGDCFNGFYYGQEYSEGADLYAFFISDKGLNNANQLFTNGTYYYIYIYSPVKNSTTIPYGTYTFVNDDTQQQYTVVGKYCRHYLTGTSDADTVTNMFSDATVKIAAGRITLELTINGERHKVVYNGSFDCVDGRENGGDDNTGGDSGNNNNPTGGQDGEAKSTYTSDHHVSFDGEHRAKWGYEGDYWKTGYSNYTVFLMNKSNGYVYGDTLQFDLITDNTSKDGDFDGKYTISNNPGKMVMMAGFTNNYAQSVGSWLYEYGGASASGYANYAMLKSGSAEFINNGNGTHTVILNAYDCYGNNITCNWTGVIEKD